MSFTFFHGYMPRVFEAMLKQGFFTQNSGIRFCQSIDIPENYKFNHLAAVGEDLHNFIRENRCPLYIDRLQGGSFFEGYDYDMELVDTYRQMLGDDFYGFQMHEWMSNYLTDVQKLLHGNCPEPWTADGICTTLKRDFPFAHIFTEAMSAQEMAEYGRVTTLEKYLSLMEDLFAKRQQYTGQMLIPCDSVVLGFSLELKLNAKRVCCEIGQQTPHTHLQIAYARGMTKAYHKSFGTYYETWGGEPVSVANYQKNGDNEWFVKNESFPFQAKGEFGGSSRSLQKRLFLYSYLSGAEFISEEWGVCNTFRDMDEFEISPYGQVKKDFLQFTEKFNKIGAPLVPIAIVIPKDFVALDTINPENAWFLCENPTDTTYLSFETDGSFAEKLVKMRKTLRKIYDTTEKLGNETGSMNNMAYPDAFDVVNEDVYDDRLYAYALNLTGNDAFEQKHKCCRFEDLHKVLDELMPCKVTGGLHHIVNRNDDGGYYLTVFNNNGVIRSVKQGERTLKEAEKTVCVEIKNNRKLTALAGNAELNIVDGKSYITVPAGDFFFGKF